MSLSPDPPGISEPGPVLRSADSDSGSRRWLGCRGQFVLFSTVLVVSLSILLGWLLRDIASTLLNRHYESEVDFVERRLASAAAEALETKSVAAIEALRSLPDQSVARFFACYSRRGEMVSYSASSEIPGLEPSLVKFGQRNEVKGLRHITDPLGVELVYSPVRARGANSAPGSPPGLPVGSILVGYSRQAFEQRANQLQSRIWIVTGLLGAASMVAAWFLTRALTHPVRALTEAVQAGSRDGELTRVTITARDEVGLLAHRFNGMVDEVQQNRQLLRDQAGRLEFTVKERTQELEQALQELRELDKENTQALSSVSHEFRTPLASLMGMGEILEMEGLGPEEQAEFLDGIRESLQRLERTARSFRQVAWVESRSASIERKPTSVDDLVRAARELVARFWPERQFLVEAPTTPTGEPPADPCLVFAALEELLRNAFEFSPDSGAVTLRIEQQDDMLCLIVVDQGPGLPDPIREFVFDKFRQGGDLMTHKPSGTGLGLAFCQRVACVHGGFIRLDDSSQGTRVCLALPCHPEALLAQFRSEETVS